MAGLITDFASVRSGLIIEFASVRDGLIIGFSGLSCFGLIVPEVYISYH